MGFLKKLVGFENSFTKNVVKDIVNKPTRLLTGVDPLSTKAWNKVLGTDDKPLVNVWGSPGEQYYEKAAAEGIDVGPAAAFHAVADKVAAYFGGQGLGVSSGVLTKAGSAVEGKSTLGNNMGPVATTPGANVMDASNLFASLGTTDFLSKMFSSFDTSGGSVSFGNDGGMKKMFESFGTTDSTPTQFSISSNSTMTNMNAAVVTSDPVQASLNENTYGGIADSYAAKYGIPLDVFRSTIRRLSDFNPQNDNQYGKGIAGIDTSKVKGIDQLDIGKQFDYAAQYMADRYKKIGNWEETATDYLVGNIISDEAPSDNKTLAENEAAANGESKAFWKYGFADVQKWMQKSAWSMIFILVGIVIIIASLYVLIVKSGDNGK